MKPHPNFSIRYHWAEGSVPPPGHYEYTIEINENRGLLTFLPDYPQHNPPRWLEEFVCQDEALDKLYDVLQNCRVPRLGWGSTVVTYAVGGATQWLEFTLPEGTFEIPPQESKRLQPAWEAIHAMVPQVIWDKMFALRAAYIEEHPR